MPGSPVQRLAAETRPPAGQLDALGDVLEGIVQLGPGVEHPGDPHVGLAGVKWQEPAAPSGEPLTLSIGLILVIAWHLLASDCAYADLGGDYFARRDTDRQRQRAVAQLQALGYRVTLEPLAA